MNAAYVYDLVELGAVESGEAIERAFSANVVDIAVGGDWERVRQKLGVAGLGLPQPRNPYDSLEGLRRNIREVFQRAPHPPRLEREKKKKQLAAKLKHRRKQQRGK